MPRYKLTIAYDGTDFCGWQKQEPPEDGSVRPERVESRAEGRLILRTVQNTVEQAVREVVREEVQLVGASRTDAGVHAGGRFPDGGPGGQVAAFTCSQSAPEGRGWPEERGTEPLVRAVNARLPDDVLVLDAVVVDDAFDPIADCAAKGYSYAIHVSQRRALWDRRYVTHLWHELDLARMRAAATHIVGEHDFESFAAAGHGRQNTTRTVFTCEVCELGAGEACSGFSPLPAGSTDLRSQLSDPGPRTQGPRAPGPGPSSPLPIAHCPLPTQRFRIDVSGNGFLYNMVRIIAGTLVEVGRGRSEPGSIPEILAARDRRRAGPTLPPEGLRLEWIRY